MKESNDILTLFESLNNHEVFTPPRIARDMLSMLPKEVWCNPNARVLDPCAKSGVFLREAMYLFFDGLHGKGIHEASDGVVYDLNQPKQVMKHILKNMLYGIATSELTGYVSRRTLYGVMEANTDKQTALIDAFGKSKNNHEWAEDEKVNFLIRNRFNDYYDHKMFNVPNYQGYEHEGNIFYPREKVQKKVVEDGSYEIEDTYYPFIEQNTEHEKIEEIRSGKMKFDVIIGNPPYQVLDGGAQKSARPIYHQFVEQAVSLNPRYLSMIIPARWYSGGKGLDKFRESILSSNKIRELHDFPDTNYCFPGVNIRGGVCYFLYDKSYDGICDVYNHHGAGVPLKVTRPLLEHGAKTFIRYNEAISILRKVAAFKEESFSQNVSPHKAFGLRTYVKGQESEFSGAVKLYQNRSVGYIKREDVPKNQHWIDQWKVIVPYASPGDDSYPHRILSAPLISPPNSCSTETYLVVGPWDNQAQCEKVVRYMKTTLVRFLILLSKASQHITQKVYSFVPNQNFDLDDDFTDEMLNKKYGITSDEISFMNQLIKPMD